MNRRKGAQQSNALAPPANNHIPISSSSPGIPRSTSPSSGFAQLLSKPKFWFQRSTSASKLPSNTSEIKAPLQTGIRKPKISHPTDPRPIRDGYSASGSKSVLDLSQPQVEQFEHSHSQFHAPSLPSSPITPHSTAGLGDLRSISRRGWSRSVDDLSKAPAGSISPINSSFQEKIKEYRKRSGSSVSAMSPSAPSSISSSTTIKQHHFPTIGSSEASPASSPPRSATLPTLSVSASAPALDNSSPNKLTSSTTHVHTRSHSFTPKTPSKLSTPKLPSSPKRKGSGATEREADYKEGGKQSQVATPTRAGFSFGNLAHNVGNHNHGGNLASPSGHRITMVLNPPTIVEPDQMEEEKQPNPKRSSQVLYHSGLINRLASAPSPFHHPSFVLSKGWKPYKMELKGTKLFFFKPPSDRSAAIKDLFPTGLVPPSLEDEEEADVDLGVGEDAGVRVNMKVREDSAALDLAAGRKRRAFWGRRTHPDLVRDINGRLEKGTFEALTHEAVFATTFLRPEGEEFKEDEKDFNAWKEFAAAVLLSLPSVVGRAIFEGEFLRCCSYLVSGAKDEDKDGERSRVHWLANAYVRYHGKPVDLDTWKDWQQETLLGLPVDPNTTTTSTSRPPYIPSLMLGTGSPNSDIPSLKTDNDNAKLVSLLDALQLGNGTVSSTLSKQSKQSLDLKTVELQPPSSPRFGGFNPNQLPWSQLQEEGLSREVLLMMDPHLLAKSLMLFHRSVSDQAPDNLTSEYVLPGDVSNGDDFSSTLAPLFGDDDHPHWLTKLILLQILGVDTSSNSHHYHTMSSSGRKSEDRSLQTSRTHSRSEVISVWVKVGELCRAAGDECTWQAIFAALCSRPIARLDKVWKRVDPHALAAIESWVHPMSDGTMSHSDGGSIGVKEPRVTPWGGDVRTKVTQELGKVKDDQMLSVDVLKDVRGLFEGLRMVMGSCPKRVLVEEGEIGEDVKWMVAFWREMAVKNGGIGSLASKFQRVEQFMSLSFAAESKKRGLFEPHFWARPASSCAPHASLIPLIFPEPLPSVTLIDRSQLIRGRVDSDASDIQYLRGIDPQLRILQHSQNHHEVTKRSIMGSGGTVISVYDGDLLLVVQPGGMESISRPPSRAPSRPPSWVADGNSAEKALSRAPSIRVKPTSSQGLERKTSMARRNSLPSLSQRQNLVISERTSDPPLRVLVQAGTLSALVNILVHGLRNVSVSVADDNGEMTLKEGMVRELVVDRAEFARVWWRVFRSFLTPLVFFELLRKLYITTQPSGSSPSVSDYLDVLASRTRVLQLISEWLTSGGGAQDALDDPQLHTTMQNFLTTSTDHIVFRSENFEYPDVTSAWVCLQAEKATLHTVFEAQMKRPRLSGAQDRPRHGTRLNGGTEGSRMRGSSTREPPEWDRMDAKDLVDNIDGMARAALSNVTEEDLYVTADLLEVQTSDRIGWFSLREMGTSDDAIEIQNIYTHIQEVEPSSLITETSQDPLYRLLPPGVRSCIRAHGIIRKWLISKIVTPRLGVRGRQARMELLLQAVEVARWRNAEPNVSHSIEEPCVRSFVETVITSAILSIESRMHQRPWQFVAYNRGSSLESLAALLSRPHTQPMNNRECLTVDMGWLIERMLEIIASPDVIDSSSQEGQSLVNFDKRRHLYNLVSKAQLIPFARKTSRFDEATRQGFERLSAIEKEVISFQFDHRGIKEEATREALNLNAPPSIKRVARPFQRLIAFQMEKNRRDKNLRSRMQKEKLQEQSRNDRREDMLNRAMRQRKPLGAQKQHRNKKSMSAFLNFMRPISSAFGADLSISTGAKRTAAELDFATTGKPSLVLSILDANVGQFINNERSFTFHLDTEDGGHYILQATNKKEMKKWLDTITRITTTAATRRRTYLGPKPQIQDHIHDRPIVASRDPHAVFGVELQFLLQREVGSPEIPPGTVPTVIEQCLSEVESRGLTEVGIYRIAGAVSEINSLRDAYNRGEYPITKSTDIHAVCDLVKTWFRVLPEPVFPASSYHDAMAAMKLENLENRLATIRGVVQSLPQANFDLLKRVAEHLDKVTDYEEHNHMTAEALAIVFSPNLLRAPQNDFVTILNNMGHSHKLVKALITHFQFIFDEADPEVEVHSEDEVESPILEADEDEELELEHPAANESRDLLHLED